VVAGPQARRGRFLTCQRLCWRLRPSGFAEITEVALGSSQIHQNVRRHSELCLSHSVVRTGMIQIVDVQEKSTMIEVPDSAYSPAGSLGNTGGSQRCLQHRWLSNSVLPDGVPAISRQIFLF